MICWFRLARLFCSLLRPVWANGLQPWDQEEEERVSRIHFNQETFTLKMIITAQLYVFYLVLSSIVSTVGETGPSTPDSTASVHILNIPLINILMIGVGGKPEATETSVSTVKPVLVSGFVLTVFILEPKYDPEHVREVLRILNSINLCIWCRPVMFLGFRFPFSPPNQLLVAAVPY